MKFARTLLAVSFVTFAASAQAQTRPEVPVFGVLPGNVAFTVPRDGLNAAAPVLCQTPVGALGSCGTPFPTYVSLSNFATYSELESVYSELQTLDRRADDAAALAGATDLIGPGEGSSNRIGMQTFTMGESTAVGASYTHRVGQFDVGAAVATTHDRAAGKVSLGFSW